MNGNSGVKEISRDCVSNSSHLELNQALLNGLLSLTLVPMTKTSLHDAPGQMHGYMYQLQRGLVRLSQAGIDGVVGIEIGDDVVVKTTATNQADISEQDKHSISKKIPFSDKSKDLWNTLKIWVERINREDCNLDSSVFYMVTNKKVPSKRLVSKITSSITEESAKKCLTNLRAIGAACRGQVKPLAEFVCEQNDELLIKLIQHTFLLDSTSTDYESTSRAGVKKALGITNDLPFTEIYESLFGWFADTVLLLWESGEEAWLSGEKLLEKRNLLISQYRNRPFIERVMRSIPVSKQDQQSALEMSFVEQLKLIDLDEEYQLDAVNDFLRASAERIRYARESRVTSSDFQDFEDRLVERWKGVFGRNKNRNPKDEAGRETYFSTIEHRGILMDVETIQPYTTRGAYHKLSDRLELGWHPEWKKLMEK